MAHIIINVDGAVSCSDFMINNFRLMLVGAEDTEQELIDAIKKQVRYDLDFYGKPESIITYKKYSEDNKKFFEIIRTNRTSEYIVIEYGVSDEVEEHKSYPEGDVLIKKHVFEGKTVGITATTNDSNTFPVTIYNQLIAPSGNRYQCDPYDRRELKGFSEERIDYEMRSTLLFLSENRKGQILLEFEYDDNSRREAGIVLNKHTISNIFTKEEIEAMTEKEVENLWKLEEAIEEGLY
jgi:hypothetical protein